MKRVIVFLIALLFTLTGCAQQQNTSGSDMDEWRTKAALDAEETTEQLYAAALSEDTLVVYTTSTRMLDAARSFEKQYPGLTVRVEDIRESDLYEQLDRQYESGEFGCDLVCSADGRGIMLNEYLPKGVVHKYVPYDIADKILPGNNEEVLNLAGEAVMLSYNDAYYDAPPVVNWWELTEEKWRGNVYMPNPTRSVTSFTVLGMFMRHSEEMAAAYKELYGVPPELPDGENAGAYFIRKLVENEIVVVNASDEVVDIIGAPSTTNPDALGIMVSSKMRLRNIGYHVHYIEDTVPFSGVYIPINVMMAGGAKNINAAKLFIRWLYGETDGTGEGYVPYLQSGAWSVRSDVRDDTGVIAADLNLISADKAYIYAEKETIEAFWLELIDNREQ